MQSLGEVSGLQPASRNHESTGINVPENSGRGGFGKALCISRSRKRACKFRISDVELFKWFGERKLLAIRMSLGSVFCCEALGFCAKMLAFTSLLKTTQLEIQGHLGGPNTPNVGLRMSGVRG